MLEMNGRSGRANGGAAEHLRFYLGQTARLLAEFGYLYILILTHDVLLNKAGELHSAAFRAVAVVLIYLFMLPNALIVLKFLCKDVATTLRGFRQVFVPPRPPDPPDSRGGSS
jgi:hypothetical protein